MGTGAHVYTRLSRCRVEGEVKARNMDQAAVDLVQ